MPFEVYSNEDIQIILRIVKDFAQIHLGVEAISVWNSYGLSSVGVGRVVIEALDPVDNVLVLFHPLYLVNAGNIRRATIYHKGDSSLSDELSDSLNDALV